MRRVIASAALVLLVATACGDDGGDEESGGGLGDLVETTTTEAPEETTTTTEAPEETTTTTEAPDVDVELPEGWTPVAADDFVIGLPDGWIDGQEMIEDPAMADYLASILGGEAQARQALEQVDVIAYEEASLATRFGNNVNVVASPRRPADEIDVLESQVAAELEPLNATVHSTERTDIGGLEALEVTYSIPVEGMQVDGVMYVVFGDEVVSTLTFTAESSSADPELYRRIAETYQPR